MTNNKELAKQIKDWIYEVEKDEESRSDDPIVLSNSIYGNLQERNTRNRVNSAKSLMYKVLKEIDE